MIKLTDTQMSVLASACERPDGVATRPAALNRSAAAKVAAKLIEQALVQEVPAKRDAPVWRKDEEGRGFSLKILKAGRALVKAAAKQAEQKLAPSEAASPAIAAPAAKVATRNVGVTTPIAEPAQPKAGSKRTMILALMQRQQGATMGDLIGATGWLPHTTRAALTGLRKSGIAIARTRAPEADASVYRIEALTSAPVAAAAAAA